MEPWDKVILYGVFDGMNLSSDGSRDILVTLENGDRVDIPEYFTRKASDFIEKDKLKLKDVIARIKSFDVGAKEVWLNEILNELGSDYGTLKYKAGYEQGKFEGEWFGKQLEEADKVRQELNKPVVKQFVADWYEEYNYDLEFNIWDWIKYTQEEEKVKNRQFTEWLGESENAPVETLIKMKLFGYEVEKEKRYLVKMKNLRALFCYLAYIPDEGYWTLMASGGESIVIKHTRKELEEAGFGEVFNSPLFEVEEVE